MRPRLFRATWRRVVGLAWPIFITGVIRTTMRTVDLVVVGLFVGPAAVAAVGIGDVFGRIVLQVALGLGAGITALVAQSYGAERFDYANRVTTQAVTLSVAFGLVVTPFGWVVAEDFFRLLGAAPEVVEPGALYLRVILLSATFRVLSILGGRALEGAGDTVTPMVVSAGGTLVNIALTVVLVVGVGPIPSYGVLGAAVGTSVGNVVSGVAVFGFLASRRFRVRFDRRGLWEPDVLRAVGRIATPQVIDRNVYAVGDIPLNAIVLLFGTEANAAFQIGRRVQQYAKMPSWGFSVASSTLVGTNLGRDKPGESERYGWGSTALGVLVSVVASLTFIAFAPQVARLFTPDPTTLGFAVEWVRVLAVGTAFLAAFEILRGALQGAGDTTWPLYASVVGIGGFALGFSYLVGVGLGVGIAGVYLGVVLDYVVRSAVVSYRFESGAWKRLVTGAKASADGDGANG